MKIVDILRRILAFLGFGKKGEAHYISTGESLPSPMTPEEEAATVEEYMKGSEEARLKLIERNLRLVVYIAKRFDNTGVDTEDLISIGTIGLIKAVGSFKPDKKLLSDILGTEPDSIYKDVEQSAEKEMLKESFSRLPERERQIVEMRFGLGGREEMTQKEIAEMMGISQSYISRLEKKIVASLKREIAKLG